jgi:hypothetical protein
MTISRNEILASLKKRGPYLQDAVHRELADGIMADCFAGGAVHAAASSPRLERLKRLHAASVDPGGALSVELRNATLELKRLNIPFDEENGVNIEKLNAATASWNPTQRIRIKEQLHRVGLAD